MDWLDVLKKVAPTVASAALGPLAGTVVTAVGALFDISEPTKDKIAEAITNGQLTEARLMGLANYATEHGKKITLEIEK